MMNKQGKLVVAVVSLLTVILTGCYYSASTKTERIILTPVDGAKQFIYPTTLSFTSEDNSPNISTSNDGPKDNHSLSHQQSNKQTQVTKKEIMLAAKMDGEFANEQFVGCEYSNCVFQFTNSLEKARKMDVIISEFNSRDIRKLRRDYVRSDQLLIVFSHESPGYRHNRWGSSLNTDVNGTMTYRYNAPMRYPWGQTLHTPTNRKPVNYSKGKIKGAYAYVSNCATANYVRLKLMKELAKYIDLDIFGGCTGHLPCPYKDLECEAKVHSKYRFYLAFENSLCKDYITEKFWKALNSTSDFVPIAMGGLSVEDYNKIAPPNSFIHVNNFTSVKQLGAYLQHLMNDDAAYNRYHEWKSEFKAVISDQHGASCDICKVAHNPELLRKYQTHKLADEWNKVSNCRNYNGAVSLASSNSRLILFVQTQSAVLLINMVMANFF